MPNDKILIGKHSFETDTTIVSPPGNGDYKITLDFGVVSLDTAAIIQRLYEHPKELEFKSEYAAKQNYFIDYIVMTNLTASSAGPDAAHIVVKCLSDTIFDLNLD